MKLKTTVDNRYRLRQSAQVLIGYSPNERDVSSFDWIVTLLDDINTLLGEVDALNDLLKELNHVVTELKGVQPTALATPIAIAKPVGEIRLQRVAQCIDCGKGITAQSKTGRCASCAGRVGAERYWAAKQAAKRAAQPILEPKPKPEPKVVPKAFCVDCGKEIWSTSTRCHSCNGKKSAQDNKRQKEQRAPTASPLRNYDGRTAKAPPSECPEGGAHHWLIGLPNGASVLPATCKKCGVDRSYVAALTPSNGGLVAVVAS